MESGSENLLFLMSQIRSSTNRILVQEMERRGIRNVSPADGDVLYVVARYQPVEMGEISKHTHRDKSTIAGTVKGLVMKGYVTRTRAREDFRKYNVKLTRKAILLAPILREISESFRGSLLKGFKKEEVYLLGQLLERMQSNLEDSE